MTGKWLGAVESEAFFAFHHINAFEKDGELFVDLAAYPDAAIIQSYYLNRLQDHQNELPFGNLMRCRIPLKAPRRGQVRSEIVSDACIELPHFDYARYNTRSDYVRFMLSACTPSSGRAFTTGWLSWMCKPGRWSTGILRAATRASRFLSAARTAVILLKMTA